MQIMATTANITKHGKALWQYQGAELTSYISGYVR